MLKTVKSIVHNIGRQLGYQIVKLPQPDKMGRLTYERVAPVATYAPWNSDDLFLSTYEEVKNRTLVDLYRCWELWTLVEQSAKLNGDIIEIGVWRGGTGAIMAKKAALCGIDGLVYLADTFRGVVKAGSHDTIYKGGEHADTSRQDVEALIHSQLKLTNVRILEGIFPDETACLIEGKDHRFRLCHIDVDVYESAKNILDWIWDAIVVGGIVVYDDYGFDGCQGITRFVNEQAAAKDRLVLHNLNGHAIVVKMPPR
jgi:O-methyltransferase